SMSAPNWTRSGVNPASSAFAGPSGASAAKSPRPSAVPAVATFRKKCLRVCSDAIAGPPSFDEGLPHIRSNVEALRKLAAISQPADQLARGTWSEGGRAVAPQTPREDTGSHSSVSSHVEYIACARDSRVGSLYQTVCPSSFAITPAPASGRNP